MEEQDRGADAAHVLRQRLALLFERHDRAAAVAVALEAVETGEVDIPTLYRDVLVPAIRQVGSDWQSGRTRVWEEHLASAVVRTIVEALFPRVQALKAAAEPAGRGVLLACVVDERHDLGLRMLADMFDLAGWDTHYLGADTPTMQIADAAAQLEVELVVLGAVTLHERLQTRHVIDELRRRLPAARILVACGGDVCDSGGLEPGDLFTEEDFFGGGAPGGGPSAAGEAT